MAETLLLQSGPGAIKGVEAPNSAHSVRTSEACIGYEQYLAMERVFRSHGGLLTGDEMARLMRTSVWQPISTLARWIVAREVVNFEWHGSTMLPLFQFDLARMMVRPAVRDVLRELAGAFDDWETALWFTRPNTWLDYCCPVRALLTDPRSVLDAARADRYIALG